MSQQPQNGGNGTDGPAKADNQGNAGQGEYFTEDDVRRSSTTSTRLPSLLELAESPLAPSSTAARPTTADIPPPTALSPITEQPPALGQQQQQQQTQPQPSPQVQPRSQQQPELVPHRPAPPPPTQQSQVRTQPHRNESAIRLRRLRAPSESSRLGAPFPASQGRRPSHPQLGSQPQDAPASLATTGRRRSSSEPQRPVSARNWADDQPIMHRDSTPLVPDQAGGEVPQPPAAYLPPIAEDALAQPSIHVEPQHPGMHRQGTFRNLLGRRRRAADNQMTPEQAQAQAEQDIYDSRIVDFLDVIGM